MKIFSLFLQIIFFASDVWNCFGKNIDVKYKEDFE